MNFKSFLRGNKIRIRRIVTFLAGLASGQFIVWMAWPVPKVPVELYPELMTQVVSSWGQIAEAPSFPKVYVVTPTYRRPSQLAELTRLAQAIFPARHFVEWLIVDEHEKSSVAHLKLLRKFMDGFNISGVVLRSAKRAVEVVKKGQKPKQDIAKGVAARRAGIHYLRKHKLRGVLYFADDDNTYDSDIFRQMQGTRRISMWPVGCITNYVISSPVVRNGSIEGFYDGYQVGRKFAVDFAEFALNLDVLYENPSGNIPYRSGFEETVFLGSLGITKDEVEGLASGCTEVMAWHTKTVPIGSRNVGNIRLPDDLKNSTITKLYEAYSFL